MGRDEQHRIGVLLGLTQQLMAQIARLPKRALPAVEVPESPDIVGNRWGVSPTFCDSSSARVSGSRLRRAVTFCGNEGFAQGHPKLQFLSGGLHGIGKRPREFQALGQMSNRLQIG